MPKMACFPASIAPAPKLKFLKDTIETWYVYDAGVSIVQGRYVLSHIDELTGAHWYKSKLDLQIFRRSVTANEEMDLMLKQNVKNPIKKHLTPLENQPILGSPSSQRNFDEDPIPPLVERYLADPGNFEKLVMVMHRHGINLRYLG